MKNEKDHRAEKDDAKRKVPQSWTTPGQAEGDLKTVEEDLREKDRPSRRKPS